MVKIHDVARHAAVSLTTVSHVINHSERVSKVLRERVEAAIAELGYIPNWKAQNLRNNRTGVVAVVIPNICDPYYGEITRAIQVAFEDDAIDVRIYNTDVPGGRAEAHGLEYLKQIGGRGIDGLIVAESAFYRLQRELQSVRAPMVYIGNLPGRFADSVEQDGYASAYRMGQYLVSKGHRRIAHVTGPSFLNNALVRQAGFEAALRDSGVAVDPTLRFEGTFLSSSGHAAVQWMLERHAGNLPTAMFFAAFRMARGGLAALADRGIRVPDQIAVATFDLIDEMSDTRPRLTTIGVQTGELGRQAAALLKQRISGAFDGPPRQIVLPARLEAHATA